MLYRVEKCSTGLSLYLRNDFREFNDTILKTNEEIFKCCNYYIRAFLNLYNRYFISTQYATDRSLTVSYPFCQQYTYNRTILTYFCLYHYIE